MYTSWQTRISPRINYILMNGHKIIGMCLNIIDGLEPSPVRQTYKITWMMNVKNLHFMERFCEIGRLIVQCGTIMLRFAGAIALRGNSS